MKQQKTRRDFLKQTSALAAGAVLASAAIPHVHAAENNTLKIASIGCGGRGSGALFQALTADPNTKLWAMADVFPSKVRDKAGDFKKELEGRERGHQFDVASDRLFSEFNAYKQAIDSLSPGDVVLLTTPPAFRPLHFAYAVEKGLNVFAEKPLAVDIPGLLSLRKSNEIAKAKGLKIGVGLNNRHYNRTAEIVKALQDGGLGELFSSHVYRCQPGYHALPQRGTLTPLQFQLTKIFNYTWLTGSFIVDALIHNLDICNWANQKVPVAALGSGGRLLRRDQDDLIDNASVQFSFDNGKMMHMYTLTMPGTWGGFRAVIHGAKGCAVLGEGVGNPGFYEDRRVGNPGFYQNQGKQMSDPFWTPKAGGNDSYQTEHDRLFKAIRDNVEWNELDAGIDATFTAILGRMAIETGQLVKAEDAWKSTFQYAPNITELKLNGDSPFMPDADGNYQIPIPGKATIDNPYQV